MKTLALVVMLLFAGSVVWSVEIAFGGNTESVPSSVDPILKKLLDDHEVKYSIELDENRGSYEFLIAMENGNQVLVNPVTVSCEQVKVRRVWTVLGYLDKADSSLMRQLLLRNGQVAMGAYSIADVQDKTFIVFSTTVSEDAGWKELWSAILQCSKATLPEVSETKGGSAGSRKP